MIYSRLNRCVFFLLLSSFCILFVTMAHSRVVNQEPGPDPRKSPSESTLNNIVPAVFFFGDSILDTGNNNNLSTEMRCDFRPYGMDFPHRASTGRFSNGKVVSDYISEYMGLKATIPAYFDPTIQPEDLLTGVSFASGGTGYYPLTPKIYRVISMPEQLKHFQQYRERVKKLVGQEKTDELLAKGVSIIVAGSNDLAITYYGQGAQWLKYDVDHFTSKMANYAASFVTQLYGYGVRQIAVIGTTPLGCLPSQRTLKGGFRRDCSQDLNYASQLFNSKLSIIVGQLAKSLPKSIVVYVDSYSAFSEITNNPREYGFEEIKKGCCGTGLLEAGPLCNRFTSSVCSNISSYLFWDSFHPTQRFYQIFTKMLYDKYIHNLF